MLAWLFLAIHIFFALLIFCLVLSFFTGAPYVPTTNKAAHAMMKHANMTKGSKVYDLGSGNGKLLFLAAQKGATAIGFEINPFLVLFTNIKSFFSPYRTRVHAVWKNFWHADLSRADIIFLYLVPWHMDRLENKLIKEARPGTRIVCNTF